MAQSSTRCPALLAVAALTAVGSAASCSGRSTKANAHGDAGAKDATSSSSGVGSGSGSGSGPGSSYSPDCQAQAATDGATPTVLASGQSPTWLAIDCNSVSWINILPQPAGSTGHSQVMSCAITGCDNQPTKLWDGLLLVGGAAVERGFVWWPVGGGTPSAPYGQNPNVLLCAISGCGNAPTSLLTLNEDIQGFTADATHAYWTHIGGTVSACPLTGCANSPTTIFADSSPVFTVAVNARGVYWTDEGGNLLSCPLTGCKGSPATLGTVNQLTSVLAVDDRNVYWIDPGTRIGGGKIGPVSQWLNGAVVECPITGCSGSPTVLAIYRSWLGGGALVVDATDVYWSTEDGSGNYGEIVRCAIAGCGGTPERVATTTGRGATAGLAVDATHVYWTDPGAGTVMVAAK